MISSKTKRRPGEPYSLEAIDIFRKISHTTDFSKASQRAAGLTGVQHFILGPATEKVLRRADMPVMTLGAQPREGSDD